MVSGLTRTDFAAPVPDGLHAEPALSLKSFAHLEPALFVSDACHVGFLLFLRSLACPELSISIFGLARLGPSSPALDAALIGSSLSMRSMARLDLLAFVSDFVNVEPAILPQGFMCPDLSSSSLDFATFGSPMPTKSHSHAELGLPVCGRS